MYTYKCEKCNKEFEFDELQEKGATHIVADTIIVNPTVQQAIDLTENNPFLEHCGGKLYRVYQPTTVIIRGVK